MRNHHESAQKTTAIKARALLPTDDFIAEPPDRILENILRRLTKSQLLKLRELSKRLYQLATLTLIKFHSQNREIAGFAFELIRRWTYATPNDLAMPLPSEHYICRAAKNAVATKGPAALLYGAYVAGLAQEAKTRETNDALADFLLRALKAFEQSQPPAEPIAAQATLRAALPSLLANLWPELGLSATTKERGYRLAAEAGIDREAIAAATLGKPTKSSARPAAKLEINTLLDAISKIQETDTEIAASTSDALLDAVDELSTLYLHYQNMRVWNALRKKLMVSTDPKLAQNAIALLGSIAERGRLLVQPIANLIFDFANRKNKVCELNTSICKAAMKAFESQCVGINRTEIPIAWGYALAKEPSEANEQSYHGASQCAFTSLSGHITRAAYDYPETDSTHKAILACLARLGEIPETSSESSGSLDSFSALVCLAEKLDPADVPRVLDTLDQSPEGIDASMDLLAALSNHFSAEQVSHAIEKLRAEFVGNTTRNGDLPSMVKRLGTMAERCQHDQKAIVALIFDLVNQEQALNTGVGAALEGITVLYRLKQSGTPDIPVIPLEWITHLAQRNALIQGTLEKFASLRQVLTVEEVNEITKSNLPLPTLRTDIRSQLAKYVTHIPDSWIDEALGELATNTATPKVCFDALAAYSAKMQCIPDSWVETTLLIMRQQLASFISGVRIADPKSSARDFLVFIAPRLNAAQAQTVLDVILPTLQDQNISLLIAAHSYGDLYFALLSAYQQQPEPQTPLHSHVVRRILAYTQDCKSLRNRLSIIAQLPWKLDPEGLASLLESLIFQTNSRLRNVASEIHEIIHKFLESLASNSALLEAVPAPLETVKERFLSLATSAPNYKVFNLAVYTLAVISVSSPLDIISRVYDSFLLEPGIETVTLDEDGRLTGAAAALDVAAGATGTGEAGQSLFGNTRAPLQQPDDVSPGQARR